MAKPKTYDPNDPYNGVYQDELSQAIPREGQAVDTSGMRPGADVTNRTGQGPALPDITGQGSSTGLPPVPGSQSKSSGLPFIPGDFTPAGYLGNQPVYIGRDGKHYAADQYNPDGSPMSMAEISGFDPSQITQQNVSGTDTRGTGAPAASGQRPPGGGGGGGNGPAYDAIIQQLIQQLSVGRQTDPALLQLLQGEQQRQSAFQDSVRSSIMQMLQQPSPNVNDIMNGPEAKGYQRIAERAQQNARAQAAEQAGRQGVGQNQFGEVGGALGGQIAGGQDQLAEQLAANNSQIYGRELQARRQQIAQALQIGAGVMTADQQQQLQRELANLDAQLRSTATQGGLSLGLLQSLLGNQFGYDQLGVNAGLQEAILNRQSVPYYG